MKTLPSLTATVSFLVLSVVFGWLAGGCASPLGGPAMPKPGRGIAEYRAVAHEAHQAVAATVKSLESLAQSHPQTSHPHPALAGFDRAFRELELTSVNARARAEAIMVRGQVYFDEWKEHLSGITNQPNARAETERYSRLHDHFERVRGRSGGVREEFRPFMAQLREFRARLDQSPNPLDGSSSQSVLDGLIGSGRRVLRSLESLAQALDEADAELKTVLRSERKEGNPP